MKILSLAVGSLLASTAAAFTRMGDNLQAFLSYLEDDGNITPDQLNDMNTFLPDGSDFNMTMHEVKNKAFLQTEEGQGLKDYIDGEYEAGDISEDTRVYLGSLLNLDDYAPDASSTGPVPANYEGNGIVEYVNRWDGFNANKNSLYNGIWGYSKGSREYALQCTGDGFHILDVTDSDGGSIEEVQFIPMPGGDYWRDVAVWNDYAYVAAQGILPFFDNGKLFVINLKELSGDGPNQPDPIPGSDWAKRGRSDYGHTVSVTDGLLFLNTAGNSNRGCEIFDIDANPFDPVYLNDWPGECHDSFAVSDVDVGGGEKRDLLYSADGYTTRFRVVDITDVRSGVAPTQLGETTPLPGTYAHQNYVDDNGRYMYTAEEENSYDIGVVDVSDPANPVNVNQFQWSGEQTEGNARMHNSQVYGKYLISAYYKAGLRVFDISDPMAPVEVGKLETWRDPDMDGNFENGITNAYEGAWNVYSFLPSGKMLVSDTAHGLYVFYLNEDDCVDSDTKCSNLNTPSKRNKYCSKTYQGQLVSDICCSTCKL